MPFKLPDLRPKWKAPSAPKMPKLPDFKTPMSSIARSLETLSGRDPAAEERAEEQAMVQPGPEQKIDAVRGDGLSHV